MHENAGLEKLDLFAGDEEDAAAEARAGASTNHVDDPEPTAEGTCLLCGCNDSRACPDGCSWTAQPLECTLPDETRALYGICSACAEKARFRCAVLAAVLVAGPGPLDVIRGDLADGVEQGDDVLLEIDSLIRDGRLEAHGQGPSTEYDLVLPPPAPDAAEEPAEDSVAAMRLVWTGAGRDFEVEDGEAIGVIVAAVQKHGERAVAKALALALDDGPCSEPLYAEEVRKIVSGIRPLRDEEREKRRESIIDDAAGAIALERKARELVEEIRDADRRIAALAAELKGEKKDREDLVQQLLGLYRADPPAPLFDHAERAKETPPADEEDEATAPPPEPPAAAEEAPAEEAEKAEEAAGEEGDRCRDCAAVVPPDQGAEYPDPAAPARFVVVCDSCEAKLQADAAEKAPPLSLDDLQFTQGKVKDAFLDLVARFGEAKVLWTVAGGPFFDAESRKTSKISMPQLRQIEDTLLPDIADGESES